MTEVGAAGAVVAMGAAAQPPRENKIFARAHIGIETWNR
jgi:hypothetical protein